METGVKIILAIVAVAILVFVGIMLTVAWAVFMIDPSEFGGNACSVTSGILITNHTMNSSEDSITIMLSNQTAAPLKNIDISVSGVIEGKSVSGEAINTSLGTIQETQKIYLKPDFKSGDGYLLEVLFKYQDRDGFSRTVASTCNGIVN